MPLITSSDFVNSFRINQKLLLNKTSSRNAAFREKSKGVRSRSGVETDTGGIIDDRSGFLDSVDRELGRTQKDPHNSDRAQEEPMLDWSANSSDSIYLDSDPDPEEALKPLISPNVHTLTVSNPRFFDRGMVRVSDLTGLKSLTISKSAVTSQGLASITKLPLRVLRAAETKLDDKAAQYITQFKTLSELNLESTRFTDAGVKRLAHLTSLKGLNLRGIKLNNSLSALVRMKGLRVLHIANCSLSDEQLAPVAQLKALEELHLQFNPLTENALDYICALPHIKVLSIGHTEIPVKSLGRLKDASNLAQLSLESLLVNDRDLDALKYLKNLKALYLGESNVTYSGLETLATLPNLEFIEIGASPRLSGEERSRFQKKYDGKVRLQTDLQF